MNRYEMEHNALIKASMAFLHDYLNSGKDDKNVYLECAVDLIYLVTSSSKKSRR